MTHLHTTARRTAPQPHSRARSAAQRGHSRRRTVLTLACLAAGVGGAGWKLSHSVVKQPVVQGAAVAQTLPEVPVAAAVPVQPLAVQTRLDAGQVVQAQQPLVPAMAQPASTSTPDADELRSQLRWVTTQKGRREVPTLDANSRLLLVRAAAQKAGLTEVGLDFRDVYGVIHAESSWVSRPGLGKNGVVSEGLAQFEPATARAVGLRNPNDPVEAVQAAALHLKEAALWSARRLEGLNLEAGQWAEKLREGVSIYYNLSTRRRNTWNGLNSHQMPVETRLHIRNVRAGAQKAELLMAGGARIAPLPMERSGAGATQIAVAAMAAAATRLATTDTPARALARSGPRGPAVVAKGGNGGSRTRATFASAAPRPGHAAWKRGKDSISTPEGTIRWSASGAGAARG